MTSTSTLTIGVVAGEPSGDKLGGPLMVALRRRYPNIRFVGVGGDVMLAAGLEALAPMERLTVNGIVEPLLRFPELMTLLRRLASELANLQIDAFIGIDFNVFNLMLERRLKERGIPTAHYVSPSVYAWRRGRIKRISQSADLLLTLYPFEPALYREVPIEAICVGHPLADAISSDAGSDAARVAMRRTLGLAEDVCCVALLPGSRLSEVGHMGELFLDTAVCIQADAPAPVQFVIPCLRPAIRTRMEMLLKARPELTVVYYEGDARRALVACDAAVVKSGTSTLEAMLLRRPMVVSYRLGEISYQLVRMLLRTEHVALPNILAGRELVPELLQRNATPTALAKKLLDELYKAQHEAEYFREFESLHESLRAGGSERAAEAIANWLENDQVSRSPEATLK